MTTRSLRVLLLALCLALPSGLIRGFLLPRRGVRRLPITSRLVASASPSSKEEIELQKQQKKQTLPDLQEIYEESNKRRTRRQEKRPGNSSGSRAYKKDDQRDFLKDNQQQQQHPFLPSLSDIFDEEQGTPSADQDWESIRQKLHPQRSFAASSAALRRRSIQTIPSGKNGVKNGGSSYERNSWSPSRPRSSSPYNNSNNNRRNRQQRDTNHLTPLGGEPWMAPYAVSRQSQHRLQAVERQYYSRPSGKRAEAVLNELLYRIPHDRCNIANIVCALGISARCQKPETQLYQPVFRDMFLQVMNHVLPLVKQAETVSTRQLCNTIWALGKHVNKDPTLLPTSDRDRLMRWDSWNVTREEWNLKDKFLLEESRPEAVVGHLADEIAQQMTASLRQDKQSIPNHRKFPKLGEVCMTTWAYGILKKGQRSLGWQPAREELMGGGGGGDETTDRNDNLLKFETWKTDSNFGTWEGKADDEEEAYDAEDDKKQGSDEYTGDDLSVVGRLFEAIATYLTGEPWEDDWQEEQDAAVAISDTESDDDAKRIRLRACTWNELANIGWAFACVGHSHTEKAEELVVALTTEATRRLRQRSEPHLPRDLSQLTWAVGTLQENSYRIGDSMVDLMEAIADHWLGTEPEEEAAAEQDESSVRRAGTNMGWSNADLVQLANAMAHGRVDNRRMQRAIYQEALDRLKMDLHDPDNATWGRPDQRFQPWEVSILLWVQARMYLHGSMDPVFEAFARLAPRWLLQQKARRGANTLDDIGIGQQEQANLAWSLTVLENYEQPSSLKLLHTIFAEVSKHKKEDFLLEHAHQLWQATHVLAHDCPQALQTLPRSFYKFLRRMWQVEKSRQKKSSMRHKTVSETLKMMGVAHSNEHDEDIDVAIVLKKPQGPTRNAWTHQAEKIESSAKEDKFRVAVEFDGPKHFTRGAVPRALGHTVLKYRLLKQQGWAVVRVPFYDWDRIPYWSSMERQRYLQRLLKTHPNISFSDVDVSEYKPVGSNRLSRFD